MKRYRAKTLVDGYLIDEKLRGFKLVAVPETNEPIEVNYDDEIMYIKDWRDAKAARDFPDRFGRNIVYHLGYFVWKPTSQLTLI